MNKLRRIFCPTIEEQIDDLEKLLRVHNELVPDQVRGRSITRKVE